MKCSFPPAGTNLGTIVSVAMILFFAPLLSTHSGYTVGAGLLVLTSLYYLLKGPRAVLAGEDIWLIAVLFSIFAVSLFSFAYHGNRIRSMDLPTRYLLAIPCFLLMLKWPPRLSWWWSALIAGCVSAAALAFWQISVLNHTRAAGYTGVIQFGDVGLMMASFCAAGIFWAPTQGRHAKYWQMALTIGALAGGYVSIASGSRGGWLALPFIVAVFCLAFMSRRNLKQALAALAFLGAGLMVVAWTVPSIATRYDEAVNEVRNYQVARESDTSLGLRLEMWHSLGLMIPQRPLLGWSESDYQLELERLVGQGQVKADVLGMANTHNNYLELLAFQGVLGLVPMLGLLILAFLYFRRRLRSANRVIRVMAVCGMSLVVAYPLFGMSQVILGRNNTLMFFIVVLITTWGLIRQEERT